MLRNFCRINSVRRPSPTARLMRPSQPRRSPESKRRTPPRNPIECNCTTEQKSARRAPSLGSYPRLNRAVHGVEACLVHAPLGSILILQNVGPRTPRGLTPTCMWAIYREGGRGAGGATSIEGGSRMLPRPSWTGTRSRASTSTTIRTTR